MSQDHKDRDILSQVVASPFEERTLNLARELLSNTEDIRKQLEAQWQQTVQSPLDEANLDLIWLIGRLHMAEYIPKLADLYHKTDAVDLRQVILRSFGMMESSQAIPHLVAVLQSNESLLIRESAAYALQIGQRPEALTPLLNVAKDPNEPSSLRGMAIESLSYQADKALVPTFLPLLRDAEPEVRFWTVYTVGEIGDMSFADHITPLMDDNAYVESFRTIAQEARRILQKWSLEAASDH